MSVTSFMRTAFHISPTRHGCLTIALSGLVMLMLAPYSPTADAFTLPWKKPHPGVTPAPKGGTPAEDLTEADYVNLVPYDSQQEFNLSELEARRFFRSLPVIAPDQQTFAYSEVTFVGQTRQTVSRLFLVPVNPLAPPITILPSAFDPKGKPVTFPLRAKDYQTRYDPEKTLRQREELLSVGVGQTVKFEFRSLSIVDWSGSGKRLLFKQRSGVLHTGLRTSDILIYDNPKGTITLYPEIQQSVQAFCTNQLHLPDMGNVAWDIVPLGWQSGSDSVIVFKVWAFSRTEPKKFLGLWQYDIDSQDLMLISPKNIPYPIQANGRVPDFKSPPIKNESQGQQNALSKLRFWKK